MVPRDVDEDGVMCPRPKAGVWQLRIQIEHLTWIPAQHLTPKTLSPLSCDQRWKTPCGHHPTLFTKSFSHLILKAAL